MQKLTNQQYWIYNPVKCIKTIIVIIRARVLPDNSVTVIWMTSTGHWTAIKRAQVPAVKEPVSLTLEDNKRPDGTTLLPWANGKPLAWDVTVPDTYADSHIADTVSTPGVAAHQAAQHKIAKYSKLASTHMFYSIAIETAGTWDDMATELVQEIGRYTTVITQDTRETVFLFQCLSIALQRGNAVSFLNTMNAE